MRNLSAFVVTAAFLVPMSALAQTAVGPAPPPPPGATAPAASQAPAAPATQPTAAPATQPTAAATQPATTPAPTPAPEAPKAEEEKARFRWGISPMGGPLAGSVSGGVGGLDLRFGAQINNMLGVYGQPVLLLGAGASSSASGVDATAFAMYGVGVLGDITLADFIYLAAGPELARAALAEAKTSTGTARAFSGAYLSIATRAGLALGSVRPNKRKAFIIGLDMRVMFTPGDPLLTPCLALGYESF